MKIIDTLFLISIKLAEIPWNKKRLSFRRHLSLMVEILWTSALNCITQNAPRQLTTHIEEAITQQIQTNWLKIFASSKTLPWCAPSQIENSLRSNTQVRNFINAANVQGLHVKQPSACAPSGMRSTVGKLLPADGQEDRQQHGVIKLGHLLCLPHPMLQFSKKVPPYFFIASSLRERLDYCLTRVSKNVLIVWKYVHL